MKTTLICLFILLVTFVACSATETPGTAQQAVKPGEALYKANCVMCHGRDGGLMLSGAKDLRASTLSSEEMIAMVTNGKGAMAGFGNTLTKQQVAEVVEYVRGMNIRE